MTDIGLHENYCSRCGKSFIVHDGKWAYRVNDGKYARLFCSWSCLQAFRKNRGSKIERREKIIQAIRDGLSTGEIVKLLNEEASVICYWRKKLEKEEAEDEETLAGRG